jgi:hypothetical protein
VGQILNPSLLEVAERQGMWSLERIEIGGIGLHGGPARQDLPMKHDHYAAAGALGSSSDSYRIEQVPWTVPRLIVRCPHGTGNGHRYSIKQRSIEQVRGLLQCVCAMSYDDAADLA